MQKVKELWWKLKNKLPYIPPNYRKWISYSFFALLIVAMPIAVWGLTTGRFELRERAASFEPVPTPVLSGTRVFVTSTLYDGNLGGSLGADKKCQDQANSANLGGTWKAWISDGKTDEAFSRINHSSQPYYLLDGTIVALNWEDLGNASEPILRHSINLTEKKEIASDPELNWNVWTNTSNNYGHIYNTQANDTCNYWTSNSSSYTAMGGSSDQVDYRWTSYMVTGHKCNIPHRLYCFEQPGITPSINPSPTLIPTPSVAPSLNRSCSVNLQANSVPEGRSIIASLTGNAYIAGTTGLNLWLERQDGKSLTSGSMYPWPSVTWPAAPNTKYYRIATCNSTNKSSCTSYATPFTVPQGSYYVFCDINNTCSGGSGLTINPDITAQVGRCDVNNDRKTLTVGPSNNLTPAPTTNPTSMVWEGTSPQIFHQIGRAEGTDWSANAAQDKPGYLNYGPYTTALKAGTKYYVTFRLLIDVRDPGFNDAVLNLEVHDATTWKILSQKTVMRNEFQKNWTYQNFTLTFVAQAGQKLEFRTYWNQKAYIKLDNITVSSTIPAP